MYELTNRAECGCSARGSSRPLPLRPASQSHPKRPACFSHLQAHWRNRASRRRPMNESKLDRIGLSRAEITLTLSLQTRRPITTGFTGDSGGTD
jgi:hypothetical protein